jgi:hypothetical protein
LFLDELQLLKNETNKEKRQEIKEHKKNILDSEEFLLSLRMIKYLVYRLSKIKYYKILRRSNKLKKRLVELINLYFPIKLIGLLLYRYDHIDLLISLLDKSMEPFEDEEGLITRKIYHNDVAFLIHLLSLYYKDNIQKLNDNFKYWSNKINITLSSRLYEEKLAITEFILRLNIINRISYSKWVRWYQQADNLLILKNILICIAYHNDSSTNIPVELKKKILQNYSYDELLINNTLRLWNKIKINKKIDIFDSKDLFEYIKNFPINIDLDYELKVIFEWDEGFGGNFSY